MIKKICKSALAKWEWRLHEAHPLVIENLPARREAEGTADVADGRRWDARRGLVGMLVRGTFRRLFCLTSPRSHHERSNQKMSDCDRAVAAGVYPQPKDGPQAFDIIGAAMAVRGILDMD